MFLSLYFSCCCFLTPPLDFVHYVGLIPLAFTLPWSASFITSTLSVGLIYSAAHGSNRKGLKSLCCACMCVLQNCHGEESLHSESLQGRGRLGSELENISPSDVLSCIQSETGMQVPIPREIFRKFGCRSHLHSAH